MKLTWTYTYRPIYVFFDVENCFKIIFKKEIGYIYKNVARNRLRSSVCSRSYGIYIFQKGFLWYDKTDIGNINLLLFVLFFLLWRGDIL